MKIDALTILQGYESPATYGFRFSPILALLWVVGHLAGVSYETQLTWLWIAAGIVAQVIKEK